MVKLYNDFIVIDSTDRSYLPLYLNLRYTEEEHTIKHKGKDIKIPERVNTVYSIKNNMMYIPIGLFEYIKGYFSQYIDMRHTDHSLHNTSDILSNFDEYKTILPGIELRPEQLLACKKILYSKRCIVQLTTGSGKTEIMCALTKILSIVNNGDMPTILIMEPTTRLVEDTISRFNKYGIEAVKYNDNRKIIENCINICHPTALGNDLEKDCNLLDSVQVLLCDETHHLRSESWRKPTYRMRNLIYSVGLSASAISQEHIGITDITQYSFDELMIIGATGPLVMNVQASTLINSGKLATPVLLMVENSADEYIPDTEITNWHKVSKIKLQSENRTNLITDAAKFFTDRNRKVLILVNTVGWSRIILKSLLDKGLSDISVASYGGGVFERYINPDELEKEDSGAMTKFGEGIYKILIGTSHLYEGVDIPNLDVIILAFGGKGERLQIQGLGRVLRKTKSGNMAYIIDFTDSCDPILSKHSSMRLKRCREIIGIPDDRIYYDISIDNFEDIFNKYESSG